MGGLHSERMCLELHDEGMLRGSCQSNGRGKSREALERASSLA